MIEFSILSMISILAFYGIFVFIPIFLNQQARKRKTKKIIAGNAVNLSSEETAAINSIKDIVMPHLSKLDSYYSEPYHWVTLNSAAELMSYVYEAVGRPKGQGFEFFLAVYAPHKLVDQINTDIFSTAHFLRLAGNAQYIGELKTTHGTQY